MAGTCHGHARGHGKGEGDEGEGEGEGEGAGGCVDVGDGVRFPGRMRGRLTLVATSFDSEADLRRKYAAEFPAIETRLLALAARSPAALDVRIHHGVDATRLGSTLPPESAGLRFREVLFCHPHIGNEDLQRNAALVAHFFAACRGLAWEGGPVVRLSLLERQYGRWEVAKLAKLNRLRPLTRPPEADAGDGDGGGCLSFGAAASPGYFFGRPLDGKALQRLGFETRRHQSGRGFHTTKVLRAQGVVTSLYFDWTVARDDVALDTLEDGVSTFDLAKQAATLARAEAGHTPDQDADLFPFTCDQCDRRFTEARAVKEHVRDKHGMGTGGHQDAVKGSPGVACLECGRTFSSAEDLRQHTAAKHSAVPGGPGMLSPSWKGIKLRVHLSCPPEVEAEDLYCGVCGQVFASPTALAAHTEDGTRPSEREYTSPALKRPMGEGVESRTCEDCGRDKFTDGRAFAQHRLSCMSKAKRFRASAALVPGGGQGGVAADGEVTSN